MIRRVLPAALALMGWLNVSYALEYFVAQKHPDAGDDNPGTEAAPFRTIQPAVDKAQAGDVIWVKQGFYEDKVKITSQGRRGVPITLAAWKDDRVCMGSKPRNLPDKELWTNIEGTKSWQCTLPEGTPDDLIVLFDGTAQPCQYTNTPPQDDQVLWSTYDKKTRSLKANAGGPNPMERCQLTLIRDREGFISMRLDSANWIVRGFEFGYARNFMMNFGYNNIIEDCYFHHAYFRALFGTGYLSIVRRCTDDDFRYIIHYADGKDVTLPADRRGITIDSIEFAGTPGCVPILGWASPASLSGNQKQRRSPMLKPVNQMRPDEILDAREKSSCAFIPVSPEFEWHSLHLPVGTDALIAEGIAAAAAERIGGIYFRPLSFGLDEFRPKDQLLAWGFKEDDKVFGMRFPDLPLSSEYCVPEEMTAAIDNRLEAVRMSGFRNAFLVNNHGGKGQYELLAKIAQSRTRDGFRVFSLNTSQLVKPFHQHMETGGHAGLSETLNLMAFRPELVDMSQLPDGELNVRKHGILHWKPDVEPECNPRNVLPETARAIREMMLEGITAFVSEQLRNDTTSTVKRQP